MVKTSKANKYQKKPKISRRISKKIKFIRHSTKIKTITEPESPKSKSTTENTIKRENEINFEYSLLNWSFIFLQQKSCPQRNNKQFIRDFINIIKNLCINKNEFISWTVYIDYFFSQSCRKISWDLETLLYIGIYTKTKLNNKTFNNDSITINSEKMREINLELDKKNINIIDFNKRYNSYNNFAQKNQNTYFDFNEMVKYIYESNNYKNVKKEKDDQNEVNKKKVNKKEVSKKDVIKKDVIKKDIIKKEDNNIKTENKNNNNDSNYAINNVLISFYPEPEPKIIQSEDEIEPDNDIAHFDCEDLYKYDNENLPEGDAYLKLDSSYENLMNVEDLFYFTQK